MPLTFEMGSKKTVRMCLITVLFIVWEIFMLMSCFFQSQYTTYTTIFPEGFKSLALIVPELF
jgi:hypothetical protein